MKKILFLCLTVLIITGCTQDQAANKPEVGVNAKWLINELTKKFAENNFTVNEINSQEIGRPATKVLGFYDSGVSVLFYEKEFDEAISRYSTDAYYGEIMLQEKQVHPDVLLKYTKSKLHFLLIQKLMIALKKS